MPDGKELECKAFDSVTSVVDSWVQTLSTLNLRIPKAAEQKTFTPVMPTRHETCLEIPFRLFISPNSQLVTWIASQNHKSAVSHKGFREIWHAFLHSRKELTPAVLPPDFDQLPPEIRSELSPPRKVVVQAKALFSPDYLQKDTSAERLYFPSNKPMSLQSLTRHSLVKQMSDGDGWIEAEKIILSSLGASASLFYQSSQSTQSILDDQLKDPEGKKQSTENPILSVWKHQISVGRDVYFVEAFYGWLEPFKLTAVDVYVTQRKFAGFGNDDLHSAPGAYLLKRKLILVLNGLARYHDSSSALGRGMPFKKVVCKTLRTPLLQIEHPENKPGHYGYWPVELNSGQPINWELEFTDEKGNVSTSTRAQLYFHTHAVLGNKQYQGADESRRTFTFRAATFAYATSQGGKQDVTHLQKQSIGGNLLVDDTSTSAKSTAFETASVVLQAQQIAQSRDALQTSLLTLKSYTSKAIEEWLGDASNIAALVDLKVAIATHIAALKATVTDAQFVPKAEAYFNELRNTKNASLALGNQAFHATLEAANVTVPAIRAMAPAIEQPIRIVLTPPAIAQTLDKLPNQIFAQFVRPLVDTATLGEGFKTGIASPYAQLQGLSATLGAVAAATPDALMTLTNAKLASDTFDLSQAVGNATLFGKIQLARVIGEISRQQLPQIAEISLPNEKQFVQEYRLPLIGPFNAGLLKLEFKAGSPRCALYVKSTTTVPMRPGRKPTIRIDGHLGWCTASSGLPDQKDGEAITLTLAGMIAIGFQRITFESSGEPGSLSTPKVEPVIVDVRFLGALQFVAVLQDKLKELQEQASGVFLAITSEYLEVIQRTVVPRIDAGSVSLAGVTIPVAIKLPLKNKPLGFSTSFGTSAKRFDLTVMGYSGGGYLEVELDTDGKSRVEGALEFGGKYELANNAFARGQLEVKAGGYFKMAQSQVELGGFLRANGDLNIVDLVTARLDFLLLILYRQSEPDLYGLCTLSVSIEMTPFYTQEVSVTYERSFARMQNRKYTAGVVGRLKPKPEGLSFISRSATRPGDVPEGRFPRREDWDESQTGLNFAKDYWDHLDV